MAQHDYSIANQDGASFRADINDVLSAIASCNSGATAPAATFPYQIWHDTTTGLVKQRDGTNSSWLNLANVLLAGKTVDGALTTTGNLSVGGTLSSTGALSVGGSVAYSARAWVNFNGTGTPAIRASGNVTSITDNNTGDYTVNFTTAFADADYSTTGCVITNTNASSSFLRGVDVYSTAAVTTSSIRVNTRAGGSGTFDADGVFLSMFR